MESCLIVSNNAKTDAALRDILSGCSVERASNGPAARRMLTEREFGLLAIDAPLPGDDAEALALDAAERTASGILLLVRYEQREAANARCGSGGVLVVQKPLPREALRQALSLAAACGARMRGLLRENARLHARIEEIRLVDRAKYALMAYRGMTEPEAHRHIEKQAMDARATRRAVAEGILKLYGG